MVRQGYSGKCARCKSVIRYKSAKNPPKLGHYLREVFDTIGKSDSKGSNNRLAKMQYRAFVHLRRFDFTNLIHSFTCLHV